MINFKDGSKMVMAMHMGRISLVESTDITDYAS